MDISENTFRDRLYETHKDDLFSLIRGRRDPVEWNEDGLPTIRFLLQQMDEKKINKLGDFQKMEYVRSRSHFLEINLNENNGLKNFSALF